MRKDGDVIPCDWEQWKRNHAGFIKGHLPPDCLVSEIGWSVLWRLAVECHQRTAGMKLEVAGYYN